MKIAVVGESHSINELLEQGLREGVTMERLDKPVAVEGAQVYIDLSFQPVTSRVSLLKALQPAIIIVNSVSRMAAELPEGFIRINGWPSFLKREIMEVSAADPLKKETAATIFSYFNKNIEWVPDVPGFVSARVVSMIINEAYFALQDNVSTREEIDTAMKMGTNYPFGPFEWGQKIGLKNICELLTTAAITDNRYEPAALLKKEAEL